MIQTIIEKVKAKNDMISEWHILRLTLGFARKMLRFVRKHLRFYPEGSCLFFSIFYLNEKELNQQICLIKNVENEISNSTSLQKNKKERKKIKRKKREREEQKYHST